MSTFQAVVQQLQKNNQDEATRDNAMVKSLELHGEQNRVGFNKLIEKITGELNGVKNTFDAAREEEANQQKEEKKLKSSEKVKENRVARFMKITYEGIKNLPKRLNNAVSKGMSKLIDTMKDIGKKGWNIAKKFLMVGALGVLLAFMNSDLWKQVTETLGKIKDGFMDMWDSLKEIKNAFFDKDGNLDVVAGLKKTWEKITAGFERLADGITSAFFDEEGNYRTDNIVGQLTLIATGLVGITLAWKTLRFAIDGFKLALAPAKFFGKGIYTASRFGTGLFLSALGGIRSSFGLLGRGLGGLKNSIMDIGANWGETSKNAQKSGGWASKGGFGLRGRFGRLFRLVGSRGLLGLVAGAGISMLAMVDLEKTKGIFSSGKAGLSWAFNGMFDVIKGVGSSIKNIASLASKKLANIVDGAKKSISGDDTKVKKTDAEIEADKKAAAKRKKQMNLFRQADADSMKSFKAAQKAAQELAEKSAKETAEKVAKEGVTETAEIIAKSGTKSLLKKLPVISIGAGLIFGFNRAMAGDFAGAGLEVLSGVAGTIPIYGTAVSMGADASLLAKDLGAFDAKKTSVDGENIEPDPSRPTSGGVFMGPQLIKGGDNYQSSQTFTMEGMNDGNMQFGTSMLVK